MAYNNYSLEQKKCRYCWMKKRYPELYAKIFEKQEE